MNLRHLLLKLSRKKMRNKRIVYIWYCPRKSCNNIITKTSKPHLDSKKEYMCKNCNVKYRGDVLMILNKDNIRNTLNKM